MAAIYQKKPKDLAERDYESRWQPEMDKTLDEILNREDFSYDLDGDALYHHYRDSFSRMGKQAMEDTVGQAAALTGGYANSYAQTAGQQVYGDYMQQFTDKIPQLYALALEQYNAEGDALYDRYALLRGQEEEDYSRYLDDGEHQRWLAEFEESKRQYEQSLARQQSADDSKKALEAAQLLAKAGDYSLLAEFYGLTPEQLALLQGGRNDGGGGEKEENRKHDDILKGKPVKKGPNLSANKQLRPIAHSMAPKY